MAVLLPFQRGRTERNITFFTPTVVIREDGSDALIQSSLLQSSFQQYPFAIYMYMHYDVFVRYVVCRELLPGHEAVYDYLFAVNEEHIKLMESSQMDILEVSILAVLKLYR